jgi:hypothetical protein
MCQMVTGDAINCTVNCYVVKFEGANTTLARLIGIEVDTARVDYL